MKVPPFPVFQGRIQATNDDGTADVYLAGCHDARTGAPVYGERIRPVGRGVPAVGHPAFGGWVDGRRRAQHFLFGFQHLDAPGGGSQFVPRVLISLWPMFHQNRARTSKSTASPSFLTDPPEAIKVITNHPTSWLRATGSQVIEVGGNTWLWDFAGNSACDPDTAYSHAVYDDESQLVYALLGDRLDEVDLAKVAISLGSARRHGGNFSGTVLEPLLVAVTNPETNVTETGLWIVDSHDPTSWVWKQINREDLTEVKASRTMPWANWSMAAALPHDVPHQAYPIYVYDNPFGLRCNVLPDPQVIVTSTGLLIPPQDSDFEESINGERSDPIGQENETPHNYGRSWGRSQLMAWDPARNAPAWKINLFPIKVGQSYFYQDVACQLVNPAAAAGMTRSNDGVQWLGPWNENVTYGLMDGVTFNGKRYVSVNVGNVGHNPETQATGYWMLYSKDAGQAAMVQAPPTWYGSGRSILLADGDRLFIQWSINRFRLAPYDGSKPEPNVYHFSSPVDIGSIISSFALPQSPYYYAFRSRTWDQYVKGPWWAYTLRAAGNVAMLEYLKELLKPQFDHGCFRDYQERIDYGIGVIDAKTGGVIASRSLTEAFDAKSPVKEGRDLGDPATAPHVRPAETAPEIRDMWDGPKSCRLVGITLGGDVGNVQWKKLLGCKKTDTYEDVPISYFGWQKWLGNGWLCDDDAGHNVFYQSVADYGIDIDAPAFYDFADVDFVPPGTDPQQWRYPSDVWMRGRFSHKTLEYTLWVWIARKKIVPCQVPDLKYGFDVDNSVADGPRIFSLPRWVPDSEPDPDNPLPQNPKRSDLHSIIRCFHSQTLGTLWQRDFGPLSLLCPPVAVPWNGRYLFVLMNGVLYQLDQVRGTTLATYELPTPEGGGAPAQWLYNTISVTTGYVHCGGGGVGELGLGGWVAVPLVVVKNPDTGTQFTPADFPNFQAGVSSNSDVASNKAAAHQQSHTFESHTDWSGTPQAGDVPTRQADGKWGLAPPDSNPRLRFDGKRS